MKSICIFPWGSRLYQSSEAVFEQSTATQYYRTATEMRFSCINAITDLRRSHCGQSGSSGSRGMSLQTGVLGGPCRQPLSCCLEVTSSPPFWLLVSPPVNKYRGKKRCITHTVN